MKLQAPPARRTLDAYYRALSRRYGPQHWWPGDSPFEVMVGAILTQNTNWRNVEKAIANLKAAELLDPRAIVESDPVLLAAALRPSGYYNQKAKKLRALCRWLLDRADGDPERLKGESVPALREELLELPGVGPETADSILLYALDAPTFVIDQYTYRVLTRHNLAPEETTYDEMKELFESTLPHDAKLYNEFHALLVAVGAERCRKTPKCDGCPLERYLP